MVNLNARIIGESLFESLPNKPIPLESDFVRMDKSIIWKFNELFWKHYTLWEKTYGEHYEASLPSGISESHRPEFIRASARRFLSFVSNIRAQRRLPKTLYIYEQGPGTGIFAKGFLDFVKREHPKIYERVVYILSDTSQEILKTCSDLLSEHKDHMKYYMQDAFEEAAIHFAGKILFARHSNMWDQWPCRLIRMRKSGLAEIYVRAVCGKEFEQIVKKMQERGLEYVLVNYPDKWKDFFKSIKLQTHTITCSNIDIKYNPYLRHLANIARVNVNKNTLLSEHISYNLSFLSKLIDWKRKGYIEIVDIITRHPLKNMHPLKFDGAIGYKIDSKIIEEWCDTNKKTILFYKLRKLNTLVTITMKTFNRHMLANMLDSASFELYPEDGLAEKASKLSKKSHLAITCTSKKGLEYTLDTTIRLKKKGYKAYPHVVARLVQDENHIKRINNQLKNNNIHEVFVAAGDLAQPVGLYESSMSLLCAWEKVGFPYKHIAITGYPEGHPQIPEEKLVEALKQKQAFSMRNNIDMRIITQLCFNADTLVRWACLLKKQGIALPVIVGIPGPCNGLRLLQFAIKCGVGQSLKFITSKKILGKNIGMHLAFKYKPDELITQILKHSKFPQSNIVGFHFYTFNNIDSLTEWKNIA